MIPIVKIRRPEIGNDWCVMRLKGFSAEDEFDGAEIGEIITLEYGEMTQEDLDALPEFTGW